MEFDLTCWRGMGIKHPPSWELSTASALGEPGRCAFSDRLYQRLDVRWKSLKYVPNLDLMLKKHRRKESGHDDVKLSDLNGMLLSVAWLCPVENRVYRMEASQTSRQQEIALPDNLTVSCCRPLPDTAGGQRQI